jgi:glycosyltransferase involved in cell wall biosynthesis
MHVLLIHQAFVGPSEPGGTRHLELVLRAAQHGHQATVIASDVSYLTGTASRRPIVESLAPGVEVRRVRSLNGLHRSFVWRVCAFIAFMTTSLWAGLKVRRVDVVFGTTPPMLQALSAWLVAAVKRVPFILEVRDLWPEFAIGMGVLRNPVLVWLARRLESFLYGRATLLVVNSPAYRDYLIEKGIRADRIHFVPNGVDTSMFEKDSDGAAVRREWGVEGKFVVLYAGALGMANDIPTLLNAAEILRTDPRMHIVLVGDGKERGTLERQVAARGLTNVQFLGSLPKDRMPDAIAAADICVAILQDIPMFRTTYPNKVFDYMAAARPTVLAIDGVIRRVVEDAGGGVFVPPGNPVLLAAALTDLCNDPARCAAMGASARRYVTKHFNRDEQAILFVATLELAVRPSA